MKARVSLNPPQSLKKAAEEFAEADGVSLNQFIALALAEKVGTLGACGVLCRARCRGRAGGCGGVAAGRPG